MNERKFNNAYAMSIDYIPDNYTFFDKNLFGLGYVFKLFL